MPKWYGNNRTRINVVTTVDFVDGDKRISRIYSVDLNLFPNDILVLESSENLPIRTGIYQVDEQTNYSPMGQFLLDNREGTDTLRKYITLRRIRDY